MPAAASAPAAVQSGVTWWVAQGYYTSKAACVDVGRWYVRVSLAHDYSCRKVKRPVGPIKDPWQLWLLMDANPCGGGAPATIAARRC
jgi:hypothetical protein